MTREVSTKPDATMSGGVVAPGDAYARFITRKHLVAAPSGIENPPPVSEQLFPFQRAVICNLKKSYYDQAVKNLGNAANVKQGSLFDGAA